MEGAHSYKILVMIYQTTQHHISEGSKKPSYALMFNTDHSSVYMHQDHTVCFTQDPLVSDMSVEDSFAPTV
jgi:hypothetical protein